MLVAFLTTLEQMGRIFAFLAIGYALNRLRVLPKGAEAGISRLITTILLPALMLYANITEFDLVNVSNYFRLVLLGCLFWVMLTLVAWPVAKKLSAGDRLEKGIYLYGLCFPNTGAVGTPLILALFGMNGVFLFGLFLLCVSIATYAWGVTLFQNDGQTNRLKSFFTQMLNPVFVAMLIGLFLGAIGAKNWLPAIALDICSDLSSCYVPISLLLTGYTVANYPLGEVFRRPKSYVCALMRLILLPLVVLLVAKLLKLSAFEASLAVLTYAGPCGMNAVVFPASYGQDCRTGASIVLISSMASIFTVPLLYALVYALF